MTIAKSKFGVISYNGTTGNLVIRTNKHSGEIILNALRRHRDQVSVDSLYSTTLTSLIKEFESLNTDAFKAGSNRWVNVGTPGEHWCPNPEGPCYHQSHFTEID
jgi:hypothetical protein